jgi:pyruvate formate lyase activating enzyme
MWCHNPEAQRGTVELSYLAKRCVDCGACVSVCPTGAHRIVEGRHVLNREVCKVCGRCVDVCPAGALELSGRVMTVQEVMEDVVRDRPFYEESGGGMTISGGEPLHQYAFTCALLKAAQGERIGTCLDTSGFADWIRIEALLPLVNIFLFDIKAMTDSLHRELTGSPIEPVLANLRRLHDAGARIRLRLPLVPGVNATDEHLRACGALAASLPNLEGVDVMAYHRMGLSKRERFGIEVPAVMRGVMPPEDLEIERWLNLLRVSGAPTAALVGRECTRTAPSSSLGPEGRIYGIPTPEGKKR